VARYDAAVVQLARLGDLAQTYPLVARLQDKYGAGRVVLVVDEGLAGFAGLMVGADNVIPIPLKSLAAAGSIGKNEWATVAGLAGDLRRFAARTVIALNYHPGAAAVAEAIPAERRLGVRWGDVTKGRPSDKVIASLFAATTGNRRGQRHLSDLWCGYADDADYASYHPIPITNDLERHAIDLFKSVDIHPDERPIAVVPGAGLPAREWGIYNYSELVRNIADIAPVILIGSAADKELAQSIIAAVGDGRVKSLCGRTDPAQLAGALSRCRLAIGVDTGALQLAAMVGCRCLGLYYGSMNFYETGPYGEDNLIVAPDHPLYPCQEWEMERHPERFVSEIPAGAAISAVQIALGNESTDFAFSDVALYKSERTPWRAGFSPLRPSYNYHERAEARPPRRPCMLNGNGLEWRRVEVGGSVLQLPRAG